jgi:hypothetical protein
MREIQEILATSGEQRRQLIEKGIDLERRLALRALLLSPFAPLGSKVMNIFPFGKTSFPDDKKGVTIEGVKEIFAELYEQVLKIAISSDLDPEIAMMIFISQFEVALLRANATDEQIENLLDDVRERVTFEMKDAEVEGAQEEESLSKFEQLMRQHRERQTPETAKALADYINNPENGIVGKNVSFTRTYDKLDGSGKITVTVGWHPDEERWLPVEDHPEVDLSGESFMPLFMAGTKTEEGEDLAIYVDGDGQEQEMYVGTQVFPGVGEVTLSELVLLGREKKLAIGEHEGLTLLEYTQHLVDSTLNTISADERERIKEYFIKVREDNAFALPAVLWQGYAEGYRGFRSTVFSYQQNMGSGAGSEAALTEAGVDFSQSPTNIVLYPIVERGEDKKVALMGWLTVHQGPIVNGNTHSVLLDGVGNSFWREKNHLEVGNYGHDAGENEQTGEMAIFYQPVKDEDAYQIYSIHSLLENANGVIASESLAAIANAKDLESVIDIIEASNGRLAVIRNDVMVHNQW